MVAPGSVMNTKVQHKPRKGWTGSCMQIVETSCVTWNSTFPTNHGITTVPYPQTVHQRPVVCAACSGALRTARCAYFGGSYFLTFLDWQHVFLAHTLNKWIIELQCEHTWNTYPVHPVKYWCRKNNCFLTQIRTQVSTQLVSKEVAARSEICHPAGKRRLQTILRIIWAGNIQHFGAQIWCPGVPTPGMYCPLTNSDRMKPVALLI